VTSAEGSIQALELIRKNSDTFDLVISDQTMPEMTGLELARKIHQWRPELPVLLCTGFSDAITAESQREAGVERVLMKPVTRQEMAAAIRKVLESRKAVRG
jgi:CheY-like chemotaxis protein